MPAVFLTVILNLQSAWAKRMQIQNMWQLLALGLQAGGEATQAPEHAAAPCWASTDAQTFSSKSKQACGGCKCGSPWAP